MNARMLHRLFNPGQKIIRSLKSNVKYEVATEWEAARPYSEIPGPQPLPLIGNTFRFLPVIGKINKYNSDKRNMHNMSYLNSYNLLSR